MFVLITEYASIPAHPSCGKATSWPCTLFCTRQSSLSLAYPAHNKSERYTDKASISNTTSNLFPGMNTRSGITSRTKPRRTKAHIFCIAIMPPWTNLALANNFLHQLVTSNPSPHLDFPSWIPKPFPSEQVILLICFLAWVKCHAFYKSERVRRVLHFRVQKTSLDRGELARRCPRSKSRTFSLPVGSIIKNKKIQFSGRKMEGNKDNNATMLNPGTTLVKKHCPKYALTDWILYSIIR